MSQSCPTLPAAHLPSGIARPRSPWNQAGPQGLWQATFGRWLERMRERDALWALDERERRDAGLTDYDIAMECRKLPWRD